MNMTERIRKFLSALLVFVLVFSMLPVNASAAETPIILLGGGDYQQAGDHANSSENVTNILKKIVSSGTSSIDGFLFVGDYDCETHDSSTETASGISSLMSTVQGVFSNINHSNSILVQGNHDYKNSNIDASGSYSFNGYSVFVMNEDDYPNGGGSSSQAKTLSGKLEDFLASKLAEGYSAPIFVTAHVPLHFGPRTNRQGDGKYASYYFEVLNKYGAEGLNIIFMHGHNHAYGYDEYVGGEAIYLAKGDKINIAQTGSTSSYTTETLNFTYMNAGYTGYYNESGYSTSSGTDKLTMTTFHIYGDRVVVNRYSTNGLYNLKSAGEKKGDYINSVSVSANSAVYSSSQTISLTAPAERITLTDATTGISVTGLKVDNSFDDNSDLSVTGSITVDILENAAKCAEYQAYTLDFTAEGSVSITMPVPGNYSATAKIYRIDGNSMTEMDAVISSGSASFTADSDGTYAVVKEISSGSSAEGVSYQRVESVKDLESGEQYLIIFDCSSQTTSDAIVIPQIATYNSGSSKRMGPDVVVSDGIGDEAVITGNYDNYLWTLSGSGNSWYIGNGSKNINVTYSSTTSRCELDLNSSGEALTIDSGSSNPGDADSYSFAIYDSSNYYWQYNTSATLVYGTNGDTYRSRFHFYKRVENTPEEPEVDNGWVSLPSGGTYVLDTDGIDAGANNKYIIVGSNKDYALTVSNGTVGQSAVTISNNTISVDDPSIFEFYFADNGSAENGSYLLTQDGSDTVYHSGGNMYYGTDNKGYWHIGSSSNGSYQLYDYDNLNWYLNYGYVWSSEAVSRFAVSSTARNVRLFKSTSSVYGDSFLRLSGETEQNYAVASAATEETVLEKVYIEITNDGYHISDTVAVTSDMVTWDNTFDGRTAGTYTGTVSYEDNTLGTITVTITAEHNFETITVDATCTVDGSVTTKCTICGEETVEVIPATGHDYKCVETAATCGKDGSKVYTCGNCADTYTETIPATGNHTNETVTVDATCTEAGSVTTTCTVCGEKTVEEIAALGHDYKCVVTDPTCAAEGSKCYSCNLCGDTYTETIPATGNHKYASVTVEPTCTETGSVTYTCEICGSSYAEVIAAAGHSYESVVTPATCTENGFTTYTCSVCSDSYKGDEIPAFGHTYDSKVTATCTQDGFVVYTCTTCGHSYNGESVAAYGHSYESTTVAPTCATAGYTTYVCTACGYTYTGDEVAALGHSYDAVVTAATCTEAGFTTYTCAVCGHSYIGDNVAALGHDYESVVTAPTYEAEGYTTHTCTVCGDVKVDSFVPMLRHTYETVTTDATCTTDGAVVHTCVECGYSYTEVLPALGHTTETVTTDATCTDNGSIVTTCTVCGDTETEVIPATGHSYETITIAPTCTEAGYTTHTCPCGHVVTEETAALGHSYSSETAAPTCTENGGTTYTCSVCGHSYTDVIAALGHSYVSESVAPTCTEAGYTVYTCETCGHSHNGDEVAALGHSYESIVTAPTCTEAGYTTHTCTVCGDSYTDGSTAALGHSYTVKEENNQRIYTCSACGHSYSESLAMTYTKVTSLSGDNNYVITFTSGSKYYAMSHKDNRISAVQVTVSNNQITSEITEDLVWTYDNSKLSYQSGSTTYYLYAQPAGGWWGWWSAPTLTISTSNSTAVSFSSSKLKMSYYYLRYSGGSISLNSRSSTANLFLEA